MSIRVMTYVWKHSSATGAGLLVHLALADFADDEGVCWPKMAAIADKARVSERGARGIIERLEAAGDVRRQIGRGLGRHNAYQVVTDENRNAAPVSLEEKTGTARQQNRKPATAKPERGSGDKGEPSPNRQEPSGAHLEERASRPPTEREMRAAQKAAVARLRAEWLKGRAAIRSDRYVDRAALRGLETRLAAGLGAGLEERDLEAAVRELAREPKGSPWYVDDRARQAATARLELEHEARKAEERAADRRARDLQAEADRASGALAKVREEGLHRLRVVPDVPRDTIAAT